MTVTAESSHEQWNEGARLPICLGRSPGLEGGDVPSQRAPRARNDYQASKSSLPVSRRLSRLTGPVLSCPDFCSSSAWSCRSLGSTRSGCSYLPEATGVTYVDSDGSRARKGNAPELRAASGGAPSGAFDRGMWIVARRGGGRLRRRAGGLGWHHADAHNGPIPVTLAGDPAGIGICNSPPFNLSHRLLTRH
jgi:hypothetical protein